jgi:hypothetical protein
MKKLLLLPVMICCQLLLFAQAKKPVRYDANDDIIDAHDGEIALFNGTYYLYGTSYGCGFEWGNKGAPFCGFEVYSSKDLKNWRNMGDLFYAGTSIWQTRCNGSTYGCFRPHVVYNAKTKLYVLWINVYDNVVGYRVFTSSKPTGPFTEQPEPTLAVNSNMPVAGLNNGDHDTFVDDDGTGYVAYTDWRKGGAIVIEKLRDDYLSGSGQFIAAVTGGNTEAPAMFKRKGKYYLLYSDPNCGYCSGTGTSYKTADHPLGPWSEGKKISDNSCGGQPSFVSVIKLKQDTMFLYGSDLWNNGAKNESQANYYWTGLTFAANGDINPLNCADNYGFTKSDSTTLLPITATQEYRQLCTAKNNGKYMRIHFTVAKEHADSALVLNVYDIDQPSAPPVCTRRYFNANENISLRREDLLYFRRKKNKKYVFVLTTASTTGSYSLMIRPSMDNIHISFGIGYY